MELLILSKLKWDLTAVTAYDYLDHLLDALHRNSGEEGGEEAGSRLLEASHLDSLRKQVISHSHSARSGTQIGDAADSDCLIKPV